MALGTRRRFTPSDGTGAEVSGMARIRVGTSGWNYDHWRGRFYPEKLPPSQYLDFYSQQFDTVEIDYSFYRLPSEESYKNWAGQVDRKFVFSVKASRYLTHMRKLHDAQDPWDRMLSRALNLGPHLG